MTLITTSSALLGVPHDVRRSAPDAGQKVLALSEICIARTTEPGQVQHGEGAEVAVRMYRTANLIRIEVDDGSPRVPVVRPPLPLDENGRGIPLVDAIADAWGVNADGTCTWCTLTTVESPWG